MLNKIPMERIIRNIVFTIWLANNSSSVTTERSILTHYQILLLLIWLLVTGYWLLVTLVNIAFLFLTRHQRPATRHLNCSSGGVVSIRNGVNGFFFVPNTISLADKVSINNQLEEQESEPCARMG